MIRIGDKIKWFRKIYTCVDFRIIFKNNIVTEPFAVVDSHNQPMIRCCDSLEELQEELNLMKKKYGDNFNYI